MSQYEDRKAERAGHGPDVVVSYECTEYTEYDIYCIYL